MKTIKIIDLLNKIANGEEVPKTIIYNNYNYTFESVLSNFIYFNDDYTKTLNDEVEILNEEDEFEDIREITQECFDHWTQAKKINQLIKNQKKIIERLQHENSKDNV